MIPARCQRLASTIAANMEGGTEHQITDKATNPWV